MNTLLQDCLETTTYGHKYVGIVQINLIKEYRLQGIKMAIPYHYKTSRNC